MERRDFLKALGLAGAAGVSLYAPETKRAHAGGKYAGPYLLSIHASGGWDPTLFFDAKPDGMDVQQRLYAAPVSSMGLSLPPIDWKDGATVLDSPSQLVSDLGSQFLFLRGIDTQTNSHETGTKSVWSGKGFEELPALGALLAASVVGSNDVPIAWLSSGSGYDVTGGLVPLTRIGDVGQLRTIARPNRVDAASTTSTETYFSDATAARVLDARKARLDRLTKLAGLPRSRAQLANLARVGFGSGGLAALADALPSTPVDSKSAFPSLAYDSSDLTNALRGVELAITAFASGQAVAANVGTGAFDTHGNHDVLHTRELGRLALVIRFAMASIKAKGIPVYVLVGSDFGRTPTYNAGNGKDHWNVTGMMIAGPGIRAGRVVGATDDKLRPMGVVPGDPSKAVEIDDPSGVRMIPANIHRAMRKKLGILGTELDRRYQLPVDEALDDIL
jgi:hypothetical protein